MTTGWRGGASLPSALSSRCWPFGRPCQLTQLASYPPCRAWTVRTKIDGENRQRMGFLAGIRKIKRGRMGDDSSSHGYRSIATYQPPGLRQATSITVQRTLTTTIHEKTNALIRNTNTGHAYRDCFWRNSTPTATYYMGGNTFHEPAPHGPWTPPDSPAGFPKTKAAD